ncbi:MAG: exo-alpha-sialidase [Clostridiales bacterium]|nr:exo-alpha-sialidase [Clostridiales bacterium]
MFTIKQKTSGIIENNGSLVFSPDSSLAGDAGTGYPRLLTLRHNGVSNGMIIITFDYTAVINGSQTWPFYRSTDGGSTWEHYSDFIGSDVGYPRLMNPMIFEVPFKMGSLSEGTLLLTGNLKPEDESTTNIIIFQSKDLGQTWSYLSMVDKGGPAIYDPSPSSTTTAVWEPFLAVSAKNELIVYYSDERQKDKGILQALVQRISPDGGITWGELINVVGIPNKSDRPGMITMTDLPNNTKLITYEVVNRPSLNQDSAQVYFKTSPDGTTWDSEDLGVPITAIDSHAIGSSPYVKWIDNGEVNGIIVVGSKWALDPNGNIEEGQNFYVNRDLGQGYWQRLPMAVSFDSADDSAYLTGMSQSLEINFDGTSLLQAVNVQNEITKLNDIRVGALPIYPVIYEAENASLTNVRQVAHYDASNSLKIGDINYSDSSILFSNIIAQQSGQHYINIRYDNGSGDICTHFLIVNSDEPIKIEYSPTKNWGRFLWKSIPIALNQGINSIRIRESIGFTEIDCIQVYYEPSV